MPNKSADPLTQVIVDGESAWWNPPAPKIESVTADCLEER